MVCFSQGLPLRKKEPQETLRKEPNNVVSSSIQKEDAVCLNKNTPISQRYDSSTDIFFNVEELYRCDIVVI